MRFTKTLVLGCSALLGTALSLSSTPASAIVGGAPDAGQHPYVGQLLFYLPGAVASGFEDTGDWLNCTGTLIDADTVVTAGHCTYAVGVEGAAPADPLHGGTDVWFAVSEAPDYSVLPSSSTFAPDSNDERYEAWSAVLDASDEWAEAESTFTHPEYVDGEFVLHDLGVVELSEPILLSKYGSLPGVDYLDRYAGSGKEQALFESVGYGLEGSSPKTSSGGNIRRQADRRLVSFQGASGYRDIAVVFSHARGGSTNGGTCFGDSGGPTFDVSTPAIEDHNLIVAVTSFNLNANCNASGSYRLDQPDDVAFLLDPAGAYAS